mmetsp:Transcript_13784/g.35417  ORF Transcript_13784/g.35417 Transcript_13784/m.35417 type:complete len:356 (-) Transcript_13784:203-1270(-)|eukprot:CAMPEP_0182915762 /NCGR_PEP_ID=MMETSP0105_2-20130417/526_1 /TAXON_ID=81532 ORGANISM="Acanthoeca-like sp., Strain 10tr" /NCGR_SAMPLE_ID=MMETSP0105_2 /ASSEMBLY_ACC=CAM_ASM_000205 /LENGTH=355 /DNA_ID=CAMNT_0025052649 /DNA_START=242 /DNA_END=1309 /DNA_ORIENTATION=-
MATITKTAVEQVTPVAPKVVTASPHLPRPVDAAGWRDSAVALDEWISKPILQTPSLGWLEYAISLPGSMFGIPLYSLVLLPSVIGAAAEIMAGVPGGCAGWICAAMVTLWSAFWAVCIAESVANPPDHEGGIARAFHPLKQGTIVTLAGPHLTVWLMGQSSSTARSAACFYISIFYVTQLVIEFLKTTSRRLRPVVKVKSALVGVTRQIPQIQYFLSREHAMHSSFPSGDASGSTTFAIIGMLVTPSPYREMLLPVWAFFPALSTFARIYFHAHFFGDVMLGHALAAAVAYPFVGAAPFEWTTFTWGGLLACEIPVIILWAGVQKLKPKSAEAIYNADGLMKPMWLFSGSKAKAT